MIEILRINMLAPNIRIAPNPSVYVIHYPVRFILYRIHELEITHKIYELE